jgi:hypothetical protein
LIPQRIGTECSEHGCEERDKNVHAACARQRASGEKQWDRRNGKAKLLHEYPAKEKYVSVADQEFECAVHLGELNLP